MASSSITAYPCRAAAKGDRAAGAAADLVAVDVRRHGNDVPLLQVPGDDLGTDSIGEAGLDVDRL